MEALKIPIMSEVDDLNGNIVLDDFIDSTTIVQQKSVFGFINLSEPADLILVVIILLAIVYIIYKCAYLRHSVNVRAEPQGLPLVHRNAAK